jgi:hypothetical protein
MRRGRYLGPESKEAPVSGIVKEFNYVGGSWFFGWGATRCAVIDLSEEFDKAIDKAVIPLKKLEGQPRVWGFMWPSTRNSLREQRMIGMKATGTISKLTDEDVDITENKDRTAYHVVKAGGLGQRYAAVEPWQLSAAPEPVAV